MKPLISVIIPIYKVEKYLERAINSVLQQTYQNVEIILVDDGSPDRCGEICDQFAKDNARIVVIHKENGGLSDARNAGIDVAKGEYLAFLDSDDFFAHNFLEISYDTLTKTKSDITLCQYQVVTGDEWERKEEEKVASFFCYSRKELLFNMYDAIHPDATYFIVAWNKLYKASLWEGIRFPKGKIHEDEATIYKIFDKVEKGTYIKTPLYAYFSAPSSITRDTFQLKRLDWMDALTERISFFQEKKETDLIAPALKARADAAIRYYYPLKKEVKDSILEQKMLKAYVRETLRSHKKYGKISIASHIGYRLFLISPAFYKKINKQIKDKN